MMYPQRNGRIRPKLMHWKKKIWQLEEQYVPHKLKKSMRRLLSIQVGSSRKVHVVSHLIAISLMLLESIGRLEHADTPGGTFGLLLPSVLL